MTVSPIRKPLTTGKDSYRYRWPAISYQISVWNGRTSFIRNLSRVYGTPPGKACIRRGFSQSGAGLTFSKKAIKPVTNWIFLNLMAHPGGNGNPWWRQPWFRQFSGDGWVLAPPRVCISLGRHPLNLELRAPLMKKKRQNRSWNSMDAVIALLRTLDEQKSHSIGDMVSTLAPHRYWCWS